MKWDFDELDTALLLYLKLNAAKRLLSFCAQDTSEVAQLLGLLCACRVKQPKDSPQLLFMIGYLLFPALAGIRANLLAGYMVYPYATSVSSIAVATLIRFGCLPTNVIAELVDFTRSDLGGESAGKGHLDEWRYLLLSPQNTTLQTSRGTAFIFGNRRVPGLMLKARTSYMRASSEIAIPTTLARYSYILPNPSTYSSSATNFSASPLSVDLSRNFTLSPRFLYLH